MRLYQSTPPEVVGPVRSAREYFFTLADGYDAIYVYHGAADFIEDMIQSERLKTYLDLTMIMMVIYSSGNLSEEHHTILIFNLEQQMK